MEDLKLVLLGFGNAGRGFSKMLCEKQEEIKAKYGRGVKVTAIATGSRGSIMNSKGIDLMKACSDIETSGAFAKDTPGLCDCDPFEIIQTADCDVVCELTPLNIDTGQPAINHIREAFSKNKHVITANKGPVAWAHKELTEMAKEKNLMFFYETTVMDGSPIFNMYEKTLPLCKVKEIKGVLNSTTNYILDSMAEGRPYDEIMAEGKRRGFIEADPSMDIEGYDSAAKITALVNALTDMDITPDDVEREGISGISEQDVLDAIDRERKIRLVCRAVIDDGSVTATVEPVEIAPGDFLYDISGTTSIVSITTDLMGRLSIIEHEKPDSPQTAYGIFSDTMRILSELI